jgi:hypothetical protein
VWIWHESGGAIQTELRRDEIGEEEGRAWEARRHLGCPHPVVRHLGLPLCAAPVIFVLILRPVLTNFDFFQEH